MEVLEIEEPGVAGNDELGGCRERAGKYVIIIGIADHGRSDGGWRDELCDRDIAIDGAIDAGAGFRIQRSTTITAFSTVALSRGLMTRAGRIATS